MARSRPGRWFACTLIASASLTIQGAASAESPDRSWIGVKQIAILSQLTSAGEVLPPITAEQLCEEARALASAGSPVPIRCSKLGDRSLTDASTAVLILHASISQLGADNRMLLFTVRREREAGLEPSPIYFGAPLRAVPLNDKPDSASLRSALRASLGDILPWLHGLRPDEPKPVPRINPK